MRQAAANNQRAEGREGRWMLAGVTMSQDASLLATMDANCERSGQMAAHARELEVGGVGRSKAMCASCDVRTHASMLGTRVRDVVTHRAFKKSNNNSSATSQPRELKCDFKWHGEYS